MKSDQRPSLLTPHFQTNHKPNSKPKPFKMMKFVALFALIAVASAGEMKFKDCAHGEVKNLRLSDCSGDTCIIHKGKPLRLETDFAANQDTTKVQIKVLANVNGLKIEVPGLEKDGCKILKCPLKKGENQKFDFTFTVPAVLPSVKSDITAMLVGDNGPLACGIIHGEVV